MTRAANHLAALESEAIHIIREVVAEARNPVMLFSAGKDSTVMAHLAIRAFYPGTPPFPLLHVDSTWEFLSLIEFRYAFASKHGLRLIAYANAEGRAAGINPFDHGEQYTTIMRTESLKAALDAGGYAATKRSRAPRSGSSRSGTRRTLGSPASNVPSSGDSTTHASPMAKPRAFFTCPIVPRLNRAGFSAGHLG
jgi:3'-phosphoadenosine 5'-phosphosulfate sulfotransferase (PAPS reductase)/FAD synthetase